VIAPIVARRTGSGCENKARKRLLDLVDGGDDGLFPGEVCRLGACARGGLLGGECRLGKDRDRQPDRPALGCRARQVGADVAAQRQSRQPVRPGDTEIRQRHLVGCFRFADVRPVADQIGRNADLGNPDRNGLRTVMCQTCGTSGVRAAQQCCDLALLRHDLRLDGRKLRLHLRDEGAGFEDLEFGRGIEFRLARRGLERAARQLQLVPSNRAEGLEVPQIHVTQGERLEKCPPGLQKALTLLAQLGIGQRDFRASATEREQVDTKTDGGRVGTTGVRGARQRSVPVEPYSRGPGPMFRCLEPRARRLYRGAVGQPGRHQAVQMTVVEPVPPCHRVGRSVAAGDIGGIPVGQVDIVGLGDRQRGATGQQKHRRHDWRHASHDSRGTHRCLHFDCSGSASYGALSALSLAWNVASIASFFK
jgi:hypothetical protein